jgi:hypothetical protein
MKSRRMRWAGHVARMGEGKDVYRVLVGRPEGKRPLGRPRRRWEDNIKMDLREKGIDGRTGFSWLRIGSSAGSYEHGNEPSGSIKKAEIFIKEAFHFSLLLSVEDITNISENPKSRSFEL